MGVQSKLSRFAGVGVRRRNPERSRGPFVSRGFLLHQDRLREFDQCSAPGTAFGMHARAGRRAGNPRADHQRHSLRLFSTRVRRRRVIIGQALYHAWTSTT